MQELDQTQELIQMLKERLNEKDETIATLKATIKNLEATVKMLQENAVDLKATIANLTETLNEFKRKFFGISSEKSKKKQTDEPVCEEASEQEQKEIAALFCTKISDHLRRVMGTREVDIEAAASEFDTKEEKEKALHDIIVSIKRASLQTCMEKGGSDKNAFTHILEAKKALQELQKTHISLD